MKNIKFMFVLMSLFILSESTVKASSESVYALRKQKISMKHTVDSFVTEENADKIKTAFLNEEDPDKRLEAVKQYTNEKSIEKTITDDNINEIFSYFNSMYPTVSQQRLDICVISAFITLFGGVMVYNSLYPSTDEDSNCTPETGEF